MAGGLLQLISVGLEDAPLILNPEITFFKTIYRKHTNFSIEQIIKNIGTKKFNSFHQFKIEKVADLLYGLHFIIDIPYFDVIKSITSIQDISSTAFNINEISVSYSGIKTYLFYESTLNHYYLVPETYFNLSQHDDIYNIINGFDLEKVLFNNLNLLSSENYGINVDVLTMKKSNLNQLLPVFRLYFDQWNEFWLRLINEQSNFNYYTNIISQINLVYELNNKFDKILYSGYVNYNIYFENKEFFTFDDEIRQYLSNNLTNVDDPIYDCDYAINYALTNNLDISSYKFNALQYNSKLILFILQTLYPLFTDNVKSFTFWKKYQLGINNLENNNIINGSFNYFVEWQRRFNIYNKTSFGNFDTIQSQIYEVFVNRYNQCELDIKSLYNQINIIDKENLWCTLNVFLMKIYNNTNNNQNICFDDYYDLSGELLQPAITSLFETKYQNLITTPNLKDTWENFYDQSYIQPVDLDFLYLFLAYNLTEKLINLNIYNNYHFLVLWRNKINIALFFRNCDNLDNYNVDKNVSPLQNVFFELNDYSSISKNLTFYHNINLQREINLDIIRQDFISTINCESFYGTIDTETDILNLNMIDVSSYKQLTNKTYDINNESLQIIDEIHIDTFDINSNTIIISNWNRNVYDKIFIKIKNNYREVKFRFINNCLYLYNIDNIDNINVLDLKLIKNISVPKCNIYDSTGTLLTDTTIPITNITLFDASNNHLLNNLILVDISYNQEYLYQLNIIYDNNTNERINIDISNNYIIDNINFNYDIIIKIELISYDVGLVLENTNVIINNDNTIDISSLPSNNFYWLISTNKKAYIPVISNGTYLTIQGNISNYPNYTWDLYLCNIKTPNLFTILYHKDNSNNNLSEFQFNQSFYQQPLLLNIITTGNLPIYYFYNIPSTEYTTSITINNKKVNKLMPVNSSEFYYNGTTYIPVVYDALNVSPYLSKSELINVFIENFNNVYINSEKYGNIINLLEQSNLLYKNLLENMLNYISTIGKTSNTILNNSEIINNLQLLIYNNWDFQNYSLYAPKYYNLTINQILYGIGLKSVELKSSYYMIKQTKDIYKSFNKISSSLTNYLNNVSTVLIDQLNYINNNTILYNFLNENQYKEKYDYKYKLENNINNNLETITDYSINTVFNLDLSDTEIYFNNILIDISSNNIAKGDNLFEIGDESKIITEYFEEIYNDYNKNIFNYLGPIQFGNNNFIFNTNLDLSTNFLLTDENKIINLQNIVNDFKIYKNSYFINFDASYNINANINKFVYQINSNNLANYSFNSILINGKFYNFNNNILVGTDKLILSNYAIIGNSNGTMETFIPNNTIDIIDLKIINSFETNIYTNGNYYNNAIIDGSNYIFVESIYDSSNTYFNYLNIDISNVILYNINKVFLLPPFKFQNNKLQLFNDNQKIIVDTYNNNYFYKFNEYIINGFDFENIDLSGNYDLWLYPNEYLKLIDL